MTTDASTSIFTTPDLRIRHLYVIGKTRMGKSSFLKNLMVSDMRQGHGLCFVDPHGDDSADIISLIPKERIQDVIYFDPLREDSPTFNILRLSFPPAKLTEDVVAIFKMFYAKSWGNQMDNLLRYSLQTLLRHPKPHTLRDLRTMLRVDEWREELISEVDNAEIQEFWEREFPLIRKGAAAPILNKLNPLLSEGTATQRVFSQPENDLDFHQIILGKKILILNLAGGMLGDEPAALLGGMIVTAILQTVTSIPLEERQVFHLYADEFQNYVTPTFNEILSGAAKFKLYMALAHQNMGQLTSHENLRGEIFGNVGTFVSFQVSADDAAYLCKEFRGSQYIFRPPKSKHDLPWKEFKAIQTQEYQRRIEMCEERLAEIQRNCEVARQNHETYKKDRLWLWVTNKTIPGSNVPIEKQIEQICQPVARVLESLERYRELLQLFNTGSLSLKLLRELFPHYEIKKEPWPTVDDFATLPRYKAITRIDTADNVSRFRTYPPPPADKATEEAILQRMREQYFSRLKTRQQNQQPRPSGNGRQSTDDDYSY